TEDLIRGQSKNVIKVILDQDSNKKLHIPQLYEWRGDRKSEHDLLIATNNDDDEITQQLLNYYSHHAIENTGWMVTLTQALPEINQKFPDYIVELFKKPIFYQKQMHLSKSRIKSALAS